MSLDSNQEQIAVQTPPYVPALPPLGQPYPPAPAFEPASPAFAVPAGPRRGRPAWIIPATVAVVGLIASGSLGYLLYSTSNKLDATRHDLTGTQLTLESTRKDLASEKARAAYVQMYENDLGRLSTDFAQLSECDTYSSCRTDAETMLSDTQAFQSERQSATVPTAYSNVDGMLADSLSAEISALKQLISALNSHDATKVQDGFNAAGDATLSVFKTESALGKLIS